MPVISKFTVGGHPVTKYNNQRLRQFVINGETCPFAKVAESLNGTLPDPISYRIHRLQASGNSSQATGSVPKYICQGASSVLNIGSFIKSDIYSVPITADGITATFSQSNGTYAITGTSSAQGNVLLHNQITLENGHKYLVPTYRDATSASAPNYFQWGNVYARGIPAANFYWPDQSKAQSWAIVTGNGSSGYCMFNFMNNLDTSVTGFDPAGCFNIIDLTDLYGAGNEPANPETVFQDYPEIPVGNDSWIKNDVIRSISSITLGGHTVSVDLRSAGSVYDEWASNSRGTRKVKYAKYTGAEAWIDTYGSTNGYGIRIFSLNVVDNKDGGQGMSTFATTWKTDRTASIDVECCGVNSNGHMLFVAILASRLATVSVAGFQAWLTSNPIEVTYELATTAPFTAGSPLTLAYGLTPTDQDGNAVTFTEGTEATPSPNYPVPIVNSSLISITDGQDTNSASIDLAGLTDKDEVYVNVFDIPNAYKQVEYIQSSGTQYIDTGVPGNNRDLVFDIRYKWNELPGTGVYRYIFGNRIDEESNCTRLLQFGSDTTYLNVNTKTSYGTSTYSASRSQDVVYTDRLSKDEYITNGITTPISNATQGDENAATIKLLQLSSGGVIGPKANIYYLKIYNGSELIRDFVPCYRKADSAIGLYDTVSGTFFTNAGTGNFTKGPDTPLVRHKANTAIIDLSTLSWTLNSAGYYEAPTVSNMATTAAGGGLAEKYKVYTDFTAFTSASNTYPSIYVGASNIFVKNEWNSPTGNFYYGLTTPVWTDITSSAMGAALLALETIEETSNTITINNSGVIDMVQYFTPI